MKRSRCWLLALFTLVILIPAAAQAGPPVRRLIRLRPAAPPAATVSAPRHHADSPAAPANAYWSYYPELYPQWYGGFSGRMLQNYGYPPGDLGLRGRAW